MNKPEVQSPYSITWRHSFDIGDFRFIKYDGEEYGIFEKILGIHEMHEQIFKDQNQVRYHLSEMRGIA